MIKTMLVIADTGAIPSLLATPSNLATERYFLKRKFARS